MRYDDDRLSSLERKVDELIARIERLERVVRIRYEVAPPPVAPTRPARPPAEEPSLRARAERVVQQPTKVDLEDLFGGRVLAWVGGSAIVLGIVFFLAMAISRGWIDEPTRVVLALVGSSALLAAGLWLYERKGQTEAALAAVAAAIAGLYATATVATQVYDLVAAELGLAFAALVGATATAIAVRWESQIVGGIGIVGALLAPVLVDAGTSNVTLAFMVLALASAVGVLVWQRWPWLAVASFVVSAPQLLAWVDDTYRDSIAVALAAMLAFWALYAVAALGYELRVRTAARLPISSWLLLVGNVVLVAGTGYYILDDTGRDEAAIVWVLAIALVHLALGAWALRQAINREIGSLLVGAGMALSAIAFADALDGPALVAGWAVQAVLLAYLARRSSTEPARFGSDAERLTLASAVYLLLLYAHVLTFEAPPYALWDGVPDLREAVVGIALAAVASFACARLTTADRAEWARILEGAGAASLVYLGSVVIVDQLGVTADGQRRQAGQLWLSVFWTVTGLAGLVYGLVRDVKRVRLAGLALLGLAVVKVFLYDLAALESLYRVLSFIGLGLLLLVGAFAYQRIRLTVREAQDER